MYMSCRRFSMLSANMCLLYCMQLKITAVKKCIPPQQNGCKHGISLSRAKTLPLSSNQTFGKSHNETKKIKIDEEFKCECLDNFNLPCTLALANRDEVENST
ncbi:hypothetical protein TNCV_1817731 [Trichonephila clavipes]|nr:hypothetical protein TNCV_1817731 [Trichonephila clavipes]